MAYTKYSLTPANNNAAPPDGAPEGMLPSAVNDTMRDMMAQIRDCGDGIRDGTYTMTAPKITGGSITGVTFSSIVVTGGSINNTPIGATTANTGAFTTLSASGVATLSAGTVSAPAITTTGDTNTGIFFPAADTIAFTEGGAEAMRIDSSGNVGIGTSSPASYGKLAATGISNFGVDQTDYVGIQGGGGTARIDTFGGNTNINLALSTKGSGSFYIWRGGYGGTNTLLIDSSSNLQFNSGYGSVATAYGCRAWVNFDATGTPTIRASGNVSSITDNATGLFTVNYTNAMPDANYAVSINQQPSGDPPYTLAHIGPTGLSPATYSTTATTIRLAWNNAAQDPPIVVFATFR